jgi:F-type H+-transporting ATPase subunit delta
MKAFRIASRYAQALLLLAEEGGQLDRLEKELGETVELVRRHPEISNLIMNSTIAREEKEDFIEKILPAGFSNLLVNFVKVLIKKHRFQDLSDIQDAFHRLYEEKRGLQRVRVQSPIPLSEIVEEKLKRVLVKKTGRKVYLETTVNPDLLGGLVLDLDGTQIDGSFRTALLELKQRLLGIYAET